MNRTALAAFAAFVLLTQTAFADAAVGTGQRLMWGLTASPRYYSLYNGSNVTTFGSTGNLGSPKTQWGGLELTGYLMDPHGWQAGLGLGGISYADDNAINDASFTQGFFGLWLGKNFRTDTLMDVTVGSLFAYGIAQTQLISVGASGSTLEGSFMMEPKLMLSFRLSPWFKMGASGSWLIPSFEYQKIRGQNLTNNAHISAFGPSAGLDFILEHLTGS